MFKIKLTFYPIVFIDLIQNKKLINLISKNNNFKHVSFVYNNLKYKVELKKKKSILFYIAN